MISVYFDLLNAVTLNLFQGPFGVLTEARIGKPASLWGDRV